MKPKKKLLGLSVGTLIFQVAVLAGDADKLIYHLLSCLKSVKNIEYSFEIFSKTNAIAEGDATGSQSFNSSHY